MIISSHISKQVQSTTSYLIIILLFIATVNQYILILAKAASGKIGKEGLLDIFLLSMPKLLAIILPLGLFLGVIFAFSKLYYDNEIIVLQTNGLSRLALLKIIWLPIVIISFCAMLLNFWINPRINYYYDSLKNQYKQLIKIDNIPVGQFQTYAGGKYVMYIENKDLQHQNLKNIFIAENPSYKNTKNTALDIIISQNAYMDRYDGRHSNFVLSNGTRYQGTENNGEFKLLKFSEHGFMLPEIIYHNYLDKKEKTIGVLYNSKNIADQGEFQWRISLVIFVIILAIIAIPLSKTNPRHGKFAKIIPAIFIFVLYYYLLATAVDWIDNQIISRYLGTIWVHLIFISFAGFLWHKTK